MEIRETPPKTPTQLLATPVQFLKGVGPQRAELLERLGLHTARDVLFFFPRDLPGPDRPARGRPAGRGQAANGPRHGRRHRAARQQRRPLRPRRAGAAADRPPARPVVQPALHARAIQLRPAGDGFGQAEAERPGLGDDPSPRGDAGRRRGGAGGPASCPSIRSPRACSSGRCGGSSARRWPPTSPAARRGLSGRVSRRRTTSGRWAEALPQIHFPDDRGEPGAGPAAAGLPGAVPACSWPWP